MKKKKLTTLQKVSLLMALLLGVTGLTLIILQICKVLPDIYVAEKFLICGFWLFGGLFYVKQSRISILYFICSGLNLLSGVMNLIN